ncbi:LOW QUALITY PROTEIN: probable disease resistance RPP8-like protein 2 [Eucalyptus grandis]|uniref:LOW QUALITY PROTEIN: probable disease resistance RPP8-like protein 2 n=1 Tax=Eucalyptus grandis TaxID=71139 RepID=UPI00192EB9F7|nr:LOW QUALITY PROTEIN: probable disease resistance RPP8-like protein 2 [Eucalyptus grandis]
MQHRAVAIKHFFYLRREYTPVDFPITPFFSSWGAFLVSADSEQCNTNGRVCCFVRGGENRKPAHQRGQILEGVEGKVKDLHSALRQVQALLRDVDARRERKEAVEECVAQLRDFAYDAEDVIERYYLKAALTEGQNIIKAYACFKAKCSCVQVHEAGTEIEGLKSRISEIGDKMQKYGIQPLNESECETAASTPERTYAHFEEEDFVGREDHIKVLVNELLKDGNNRVISICGMGGLGKTTLAKKVFAHDKVKKHFDGFAWACISQKYRVRDILEGILAKLNPDQREGVTKMKDDELFETLYMTQKQKRCIVVLDDIWTEQAWVGLRNAFPTKDTRSKLLITTSGELGSAKEEGLVVEISSDGSRVGQDIVAGQAVEDIAKQSEIEGQIPGFVSLNANNGARGISVEDVAKQYALEESFLSILNIQQDNETENCSASMAIKVESSCKIRRLSLTRNVIPSLKASRRTLVHLRTLMSFEGDKWEPKQFQSIFKDYKFLRILKLENVNVMGSLPRSVGDLVHLRFLSLVGSRFNDLPQSMGNLVSMEFLDLGVDTLVSMPNVLWKMRRLRYLRLPYNFDVKEKFHWGRKKLRLGTLKNLRTLRNFSLKKCDVNDVGKLTNLQKLTVCDNFHPIELEIFLQLAEFNLNYLQSLSFYSQNHHFLWTEGGLNKMSNYPYSCKLSIFGNIEKLLEHKSLPEQLRKLVLINSKLEEDPMPILEKLPHLVFLMLGCDAFLGKEMVCSAGGFPQLKHLFFGELRNLEEWRAAEGAVPHLSRLGIFDCPKLKVVPSHVSTYNGSDEILKEHDKSIMREMLMLLAKGGPQLSYAREKIFEGK